MSRAALAALGICSIVPAWVAAQDQPYRFGTTVVIPAGLRGQIYHIKRNSARLPEFRKLKSVGTIYTTYLDIPPQPFDAGFPGVTRRYEWFAIDYTGRFWIETPGVYRFGLLSDDGSKLLIDNQMIIDNDGTHAPQERTGTIELTNGIHRLEVQYFQGPRFHVALALYVQSPGGSAPRVFHVDEFRPPPDANVPADPPPQTKKGK
jgi:hypothetical protein